MFKLKNKKIKNIPFADNTNSKRKEKFVIIESAYKEILQTIGKKKPESGGILLGFREDYIIRKFVFDPTGSMSNAAYDPDVDYINKVIKNEWEEHQLELLGFVHSHPRGISRLSSDRGNNTGDIGYMKAIFGAIKALEKFLVPILFSSDDGGTVEFFPYLAYRGNEENYIMGDLIIINDQDIKEPLRRESRLTKKYKTLSIISSILILVFCAILVNSKSKKEAD